MVTTPETVLLYSTFPNREAALTAARALVEKRLIACANVIDNVVSVYRWEGKTQQEAEVTLIAKTTHGKFTAAMKELKSLHPYEVPCMVALPITQGYAPFLEWIKTETT